MILSDFLFLFSLVIRRLMPCIRRLIILIRRLIRPFRRPNIRLGFRSSVRTWSDAWWISSDAWLDHQTPDPLDQTPRVQIWILNFLTVLNRLTIRRLIPWIRRLIRFIRRLIPWIRRLIPSNRCFPVQTPLRFLLGHDFKLHRLVPKRPPILANKDPLESWHPEPFRSTLSCLNLTPFRVLIFAYLSPCFSGFS